jgi:3-hydroxyacyl-[acyl-carrier-protein] dehydratase
MTNIPTIDSIPHRSPMLMVDEIVSCDEDSIACRRTFRKDEYFFQGHYPDYPIVPGVILCECAAQSAALLLANRRDDDAIPDGQVPVLTRLNNVRFKKILRPGDTVDVAVRLEEVVSNAYFLSATIRSGGKVAATLDLACSAAPRPGDPSAAG